MERFEYFFQKTIGHDLERMDVTFNRLGDTGYEFVTYDEKTKCYIFKRRKLSKE